MSQLQALIFDVDGTLAETERDGHRVAFNRAFVEAGLPWNWSIDLYGKLVAVSGGKERLKHYIRQYQSEFDPPGGLDDFVRRLHATKTEIYRQLLQDGAIPLRCGVKRLLEEARRENLRLAIATTSALPNATALLEKHLDPDWFEEIAAGDIVSAKKPAPDIYHYVLDKLALSPENCLVFEDSPHGLQASLGAGLKTVVTVNDYTRHGDFRGAALVLGSLGEPDEPFEMVSGNAENFDGATYFDCGLARRILESPTT
ncbi:HAD-IA family hydrolase [Baaleninema sp.]|uniref:HAD-IA family hydrolase n=1 Tax=Baaleninema sp. TaxID=3101197 RepID=UPI003D091B43